MRRALTIMAVIALAIASAIGPLSRRTSADEAPDRLPVVHLNDNALRITADARNIVPNPRFESYSDADGLPEHWQISAAEAVLSEEDVVEGRHSLMIAARGPDHPSATATTRFPIDRTGLYDFDVAIPRTEGRARLSVTIGFYDVFGQRLADEAITLERVERGEGRVRHIRAPIEVPRLAAEATLSLEVRSDRARAWWDAVQLRHRREIPHPTERPLETWRACWIWAEATREEDGGAAYFRRSFRLPADPERVTSAILQIAADDQYTLRVNGERVGRNREQEGWREPDRFDLQPHLVRGSNTIAVETHHLSGSRGLLAEAAILWPRGEITVITDDTWRAVGEAEEDWAAPDFDDRRWPAAAIIAEAGEEPWGYLPYTYEGRREEIELRAIELPTALRAGSDLKISARVSALPESATEKPLHLSLRRDGREILRWSRPVERVTRELSNGVRIGPITVHLSRFLAPATYSVALGFPHMRYVEHEGIEVAELRVRSPAESERTPRISIAEHGGLPTLHINDRPHPFLHYQTSSVIDRQIGNIADAGLHIYFLDAEDIGWRDTDTFDYSAWDAKVTRLLLHDPKAMIVPTFMLCGRSQPWWSARHPEEVAQAEAGDPQLDDDEEPIISLASRRWRRRSSDALRRFVMHCSSAPYATRILGYLPAFGAPREQARPESAEGFPLADYSEPMHEAFREWLRDRYETEVQLREAWQMPEMSFETVTIPSAERQEAVDHMLFRDPQTSRDVIDFHVFHREMTTNSILHYFGVIKDAGPQPARVGTYHTGVSGNMALSRLLESDLCDFLISPWGGAMDTRDEATTLYGASGSALVNGKLWAVEAGPYPHPLKYDREHRLRTSGDLPATISSLQRSLAAAVSRGAAVGWNDLDRGWLASDPRQTQMIGRLRSIAGRWVNWDRSPDPEGIAVVVDEETPFAYLNHQIEAMYWLLQRQKSVFERVGAPWNVYLLEDVVAGRVPRKRAYFFLNCFRMTRDERAFIDEELKSEGRLLAWLYAPGYIADDLDVTRISELTGMDFEEIAQTRPWRSSLVSDHPWAVDIPAEEGVQPGIEIGPIFVPKEDGIEVVARWEDGGEPAIAVGRHDDWTSVYSAGPVLSPTLLKRICSEADIAIRVAGTGPSYVSRNFVGLHSASPRIETLQFDRPTRVIDLVSGEILAARATRFEIEVSGTRLLRTISID